MTLAVASARLVADRKRFREMLQLSSALPATSRAATIAGGDGQDGAASSSPAAASALQTAGAEAEFDVAE